MSDINVIVNDEIVNIDVIDEPVLVNVINSPGVPGAPGQGVPVGGTTGQVLAKNSATNYDTEWVDVIGGAWGTITGTLSNQTDLQTALDAKFDDPTGTTSQYLRGDGSLATFPSLTGFVPYTGATTNVDLGTHRITAQNATIASSGSGDTVTLNHSSGSGIGLNITKGGNGEGLYINKTGGSGNAATIIGTINATTLVKSGGTSSQFLKADGTVDSSVYVPTSREITINGVTFDLSANRSWTVSGGISGSGASGQLAYWNGTTSQTGSADLQWNGTNLLLGNDKGIVLQTAGTNRNISLRPTVILDNFAGAIWYPSSGTNVGSALIVSPRGTGYSNNIKSQITIHNTDYVADNVNYELAVFRAGGTNYSLSTGKSGTGTTRPLLLSAGFATDGTTNGNQLWLYTNGNVGINTSSDGGQRLQVQGTTLLNGNVTFSSATGMTWDATNGRLGIGTNAPAYTLEMRGARFYQSGTTTTAATTLYQVVDNTTVNNSYVLFGVDINGTTTGFNQQGTYLSTGKNGGGTLRPIIIHNFDSQPIIFATGNTERARIFGTGNVGINTGSTDSGERLQVTGTGVIKDIVTSSVASALFQLSSTTKGFLPPRMTTTQKNAITSPAAGLVVYDTTDNKHYGYDGTTWNAFY
jgi:hypothetical protein